MYAFIDAIILGIIEGITEFLPISSTGHVIVFGRLLDFQDSNELFTVVVQLGAIAAIIWHYRQDLWQRTLGLIRWQADALRFWLLIVLGTVPAGIFGLLLDEQMDHIATPAVIAWALIVGGIILWLVDRKPRVRPDGAEQPVDFNRISPKRALAIGLGQCVAIIPGVSRSGATIVSGLAAGLNRPTATAFSFYLSIPVLVLASIYKLAKYGDSISTIPGGLGSIGLGIAAAFITASLAVSWLLRYIATHDFKPFAYYRIALGTGILILLGLGFF